MSTFLSGILWEDFYKKNRAFLLSLIFLVAAVQQVTFTSERPFPARLNFIVELYGSN